MSRIGITLLDVEKAALEIQAQGKIPTIDRIRAILNTGSNTTIGEHLKTWRSKQVDGKGNIPQTLLVLVTKLWEELQADANERINSLLAEHHESEKTLKQTITQLNQKNAQLEKDLHHQQETLFAEQQAGQASIAELEKLKQSHEKVFLTQQGLVEKLEGSNAENVRLHHLASQMQANLSHYQDAIQQLRAQQVIEFEKQQSSWKQEATLLKQRLTEANAQIKVLDQQIIQYEFISAQNKEQLLRLNGDHEVMQNKFNENMRSLAVVTERFNDREKTTQSQCALIEKKDKYISSMEKENAVLFDKIVRFEKELHYANEKIASLRDEKLFLSQEKTELLCQVRQLTQKNKFPLSTPIEG